MSRSSLIYSFGLVFASFLVLGLGDQNQTALEDLLTRDHLFGIPLYKQLVQGQPGNLVQSHLSAFTILSLAYLGSRGETSDELRNVLHLTADSDIVKAGFKALVTDLNTQNGYQLNFVNKVYVKNDFEIKADFKTLAQDIFNASIENLDFGQNQQAANSVNTWVSQATNGKITELISPSILNNRTRLVLLNALYFQGKFSTQFDPDATYIQEFYPGGELVKIPTMHHTAHYNYYESPELDAKFLQLEIEGGEASLVIILPNSRTGLSEVEAKLEALATPPNFTKEHVYVSLPKFRIESSLQLNDALEKLGAVKAFREQEADFSGLGGVPGQLFIKDVLQKVYIKVEEGGVEAAAATAVVGEVPRSLHIDPDLKEFVADHPFLFFVQIKSVVVVGGRAVIPTL